jgi:hypothetical protein
VPAAVDLEDRDRNVEAGKNRVDQPVLLPRGVIRTPQRDQDVVWPKLANRVRERGQRRLVPDTRPRLGPRREFLHVTEDGLEALVRLEASAIRVRGEPAKPPHENGRHNDDLRCGLDELSDKGRQLFHVRDRLSRRDQEPSFAVGSHHSIMPSAPTGGIEVGSGQQAPAVDCDRRGWPANVVIQTSVTLAGSGRAAHAAAFSVAHDSAKSAISSQPACAGMRCARPSYSTTSVIVPSAL